MNSVMVPKSILFVAANPKQTNTLRLHEEEREIKEKLRLAGYGKVPINSTGATRTGDIQQALLDFNPQIIHFSGHGEGSQGLVFEDSVGIKKLVNSEALANLFKIFSKRGLECVVLNACYSKFQAEAIAQHIKFVIGMSDNIGDRAAIEFSVGFYRALSAGESIEFAYELGCNAIQLAGISEYLTPVLYKEGELISGDAENHAVGSTNDEPPQVSPDGIEKNTNEKDINKQNSEITRIFKELCAERFEVDENQIQPDSDLANDFGCDDLDIKELIMDVEEKFNIDIPDEDIYESSPGNTIIVAIPTFEGPQYTTLPDFGIPKSKFYLFHEWVSYLSNKIHQ